LRLRVRIRLAKAFGFDRDEVNEIVELVEGSTIRDAILRIAEKYRAELLREAVRSRQLVVLVNSVETDVDKPVSADGDVIEVLPVFAGG